MKIIITAKEAIEKGWDVKIAGELGLNLHGYQPEKEITITEQQLNAMEIYIK